MAQNRPNWMWAEALQLLDQAERAHRDLFQPSAQRRRTACWEPPVDVFETDGEVWIQVALPGVGSRPGRGAARGRCASWWPASAPCRPRAGPA